MSWCGTGSRVAESGSGIPAHPRVVWLDENDGSAINGGRSSDYWRQYVDTWEIRDRRLYLTSLVGACTLVGEEPLFVDGYTGTLRIPVSAQRLWRVRIVAGCVVDVWEEIHDPELMNLLRPVHTPAKATWEESHSLFWYFVGLLALWASLHGSK